MWCLRWMRLLLVMGGPAGSARRFEDGHHVSPASAGLFSRTTRTRLPGCPVNPTLAFWRTSSSSLHKNLAVVANVLPCSRECLRSSRSISDQGSPEFASIAVQCFRPSSEPRHGGGTGGRGPLTLRLGWGEKSRVRRNNAAAIGSVPAANSLVAICPGGLLTRNIFTQARVTKSLDVQKA